MPDTLALPILGEMAPGGLTYGKNYLVEFDPHSLWYEASLTIAADSARHGTRTDYHTFAHIPGDVKEALRRLGVNEKRLEDESTTMACANLRRVALVIEKAFGISVGDSFAAGADEGSRALHLATRCVSDLGFQAI